MPLTKFWKKFEEFLIRNGLHEPIGHKRSFQEILYKEKRTEKSGLPAELVYSVKSEDFAFENFDISCIKCPPDYLLHHINPSYAKYNKLIPLSFENNILTVAMAEPNSMVIDEIINIYKKSFSIIDDVKIVIIPAETILELINRFYHLERDDVLLGNILSKVEEAFKPQIEVADVPNTEITENSAPIVMLVNKTIKDAYKKRASDIHIEPAQGFLRVRYRIDGELIEAVRVPKYAQNAIIARIKVMADMKLDEKRLPQDGRIDFSRHDPSTDIDIRVSSVPTPLGEDVVLRILDKKSSTLSLNKLGFNSRDIVAYQQAINSPYGIILHVGPTGSGKTTALYAALKSLDEPNTKIVTAEDPVEYVLGGQIIQSNVNPLIGYTFAKAIKAFLRHDPDIILIGEIRDFETAKIAVEASLTGHLVFSTLHTNDAIGTITRLVEMGIEPYLLADSLRLICAQRLVRVICNKCKESYIATDKDEEVTKGDIKSGTKVYRGKGCNECEGIGYKGRTGIYEVLSINKSLRSLLLNNVNTEVLRDEAIKSGMTTLRQDAVQKVLSGITTIEELISTTLSEI